MSTPHNNAKKGDIARTVLMPGDPLRAKFIAETYLENAVCYNEVRGMLGFTGTYKGVSVSVQGSGMGMPSMGIYSQELYNEYDVENIIRIGTAGSIADKINLREIIIGVSASTNSNYASQYRLPGTYAPTASWKLIAEAVKAAEAKGCAYHAGNILSSDTFIFCSLFTFDSSIFFSVRFSVNLATRRRPGVVMIDSKSASSILS